MEIQQQEDLTPWYAIKLYSVRHKAISQWLEEQKIEYFVPMHYVDIELEGRVKHILRPVVSNLVFVKKCMPENVFRQFVYDSPYKMSVITKSRQNRDFCEIPAREMQEFRMMCNPEVELRKYVSEQEAKLKAGTPVLVKYGPLKGLSGKLVRSNKKYYLLKEVPGLGVMLKVSRWCCVAIPEENTEKT
ncbi:MAG: UpxY family transcription antiterminator [Prevotella sp.]|nr:UpxY family transcription antiterminator [Prevotella sp.]MBR5036183.1 UpxY family transcription antiterminator [Prevotella sp.]